MKLILTIFLTVTLSMIYHHSVSAQQGSAPFTAPSPFDFLSPSAPVKFISFNSSINKGKVLLNWTVADNQETDRFEVERSTDGKIFVTAALIFATNKTDTDNYFFFEKAKKIKTYYRIRIISKNGSAGYSPVITVK